jgi:hypothetical protein
MLLIYGIPVSYGIRKTASMLLPEHRYLGELLLYPAAGMLPGFLAGGEALSLFVLGAAAATIYHHLLLLLERRLSSR